MYNHTLKFTDQAFQLGMTLPANTSATATNAMRVDGTNGRLAISLVANGDDVALALGKILTVTYTECATETGTFAAPASKPSLVTTYAAAIAPTDGTKIVSMLLPTDVEKWVKVVVTTDDAAAAGEIDVVLEYLAG